MSQTEFNDDCPGCRPVAVDPDTLKPMAEDTPIMRAIDQVWSETTLEERQAFHRFTCLNSRALYDVGVMRHITKRIEQVCLANERTA